MIKKAIYFCAGCDSNTVPTQVDDLLINVLNNSHSDTAINATKELVEYAGVKYIFMDSSGFSLHMQEEMAMNDPDSRKKAVSSNKYKPITYINEKKEPVINVSPESVIMAAMTFSAQIVASLDYPLRKKISKNSLEFEFQNKLSVNMQWAKKTYELKQKYYPSVKLYLPLQIYTISDFFQFTAGVRDLEFDGYAIPYRNINEMDLVEFMYETYKLGIKNFHVFGTAEFSVLAVSAYVGRHLFDWMSWDATSWRLFSQMSEYVNPHNLKPHHIDANTIITDENNINVCSCPWCKEYTYDDIKAMSDNSRASLLRSHNYHTTRRVALELYDNSESLSDLTKMVKFNDPKNSKTIVDALRRADYLIQYNRHKN